MTKSELFALTARLKRAFPRHQDVLALCAEAEALSHHHDAVVARVAAEQIYDWHNPPKRDRAAYMREYRKRVRKWNGGQGWSENTVPESAQEAP